MDDSNRRKRNHDKWRSLGGLIKRTIQAKERTTGQRADQSLEAELELLREENAYLRMQLAAAPNVQRAVRQISSLDDRAQADDDSSENDDWNRLVDSLVIRDTLADACSELISALSAVENRLELLAPPSDPMTAIADAGATGREDEGVEQQLTTSLAKRRDGRNGNGNRNNGNGNGPKRVTRNGARAEAAK